MYRYRALLASLLLAGCDVGAAAAAQPIAEPPCELAWDEYATNAPATLELRPWTGSDTSNLDECPTGFDPRALLAATGCKGPDCVAGHMTNKVTSAVVVDGPGGSGHFEEIGIAIGDAHAPRYACIMGSTVGWRALPEHAHRALAPLAWSADVDGDGATELVVWTRLPWGSAEVTNALAPAIYALDSTGSRLVHDDRRGGKLAKRVALEYRAAAKSEPDTHERACYAMVADALDHWGQ